MIILFAVHWNYKPIKNLLQRLKEYYGIYDNETSEFDLIWQVLKNTFERNEFLITECHKASRR